MAGFEVDLSDDSRGVVYDFPESSRTAVVAFGGLFTRMGGIPPFEFFGQLDDVPAARVFVRDLDQAWYQCGIRGVARDIAGGAAWLGDLLSEHRIERTVCVGCSAGGFAAIAFGCLVGAERVHAFGAQTTIRRRDLWRAGDHRWDKYLKAMRPKTRGRSTVRDVKPVVEANGQRTAITLHWGSSERRDGFHARRLASLPNVAVVSYDDLGHGDLTRALRDRGELRTILFDAVS